MASEKLFSLAMLAWPFPLLGTWQEEFFQQTWLKNISLPSNHEKPDDFGVFSPAILFSLHLSVEGNSHE